MDLWLTALAILVDAPGSIPNAHKYSVAPAPGDPTPSFSLHGNCTYIVHTHADKKDKIRKKKQLRPARRLQKWFGI